MRSGSTSLLHVLTLFEKDVPTHDGSVPDFQKPPWQAVTAELELTRSQWSIANLEWLRRTPEKRGIAVLASSR
jgi:hypothetical protein